MKKRTVLAAVCFGLAAVFLALAGWTVWKNSRPPELPAPRYTLPPPLRPFRRARLPLPPRPGPGRRRMTAWLPPDRLFISEDRAGYVSGSMRLVIPKLEVDIPVLDGVDEQTLLQGEGLYDYAQLPGETGGNVSIAGHRNWVRNGQITDDVPFYYLHTIGPGDCLYLVDLCAHLPVCSADQTSIIEPDDWSVIYCQGFSCLTLTTCTPNRGATTAM